MIRFWCQCGRQLKSSEYTIGQPVQCPLCRRLTIVPEEDVPRTADFPPVPDRRASLQVNQYGEVLRAGTDTEAMPNRQAPERRPGSGKAIWSLVLGLLSFPCMLGVLTGIPALITGLLALRERAVRSGEKA